MTDLIERLRTVSPAYTLKNRMLFDEAADELERATRLIRRLCNDAPESPGCLYPACDCGMKEGQ